MSVKIAPSILSSDFGRLAEQVAESAEAGADWIHVDVMDGHFVPNITIGPAVTAAVRAATDLPVDVHLMIEQPERYLEAFADAGADFLTVHQEACRHLHRTLEQIRELDVRPGVTLNPVTPVETLTKIVPYVDLALVMSVNPGFGGQSYIPLEHGEDRTASGGCSTRTGWRAPSSRWMGAWTATRQEPLRVRVPPSWWPDRRCIDTRAGSPRPSGSSESRRRARRPIDRCASEPHPERPA